ncbi:hypothetical protein OIDMADRAFT_20434 [Oidiodendron maius Zn]|uniref:Histone H1 n=1 Tax=Oidiodendron maius (strain Zn) TaxID=913774 RepID=A0A0C3D8F2_OIDMZ|nr:hypothetical protein OIDMADRAFT_20434 [Oidiodendron maius Zn]
MAPKAAAAKGKSGSSDHASYQDMITDAIINLKDRNGSSRSALKKYVKANNKISADAMFDSLFNRALRAGVEKGVFAQPKGASGGTKLAKKEPKPAAAKTEKKATTAKPKKAVSATKKTTTAKATKPKAAPKAKATKTAKPKAAKPKAAPKAKKPAAAKAAPAVVDKPAVLGKTKSGRVTKTTAKTPAKKATPKKAAPKKATPKKAAA